MNNMNNEKKEYIDVNYQDISKDINGEPLFYTTSQVAEILGEETSCIRYWTKRFEKLLDVEISNRNRQYKKSDIEKLKFIKKLTKEDGMTLQQVENYCTSKGFDIKDIRNSVLDANNPLIIKTFISAVTVDINNKIEDFLLKMKEENNQVLKNQEELYKKFLEEQNKLNDKWQQEVSANVDEIVSEKMGQLVKEVEATRKEAESINKMRMELEEKKKDEENKNKGFFKKWFRK